MQTLRNFQVQAIVAALADPVAHQRWVNRPAEFYSFRADAKHLHKPAGMSKRAFKQAKIAARNGLHIQMNKIRAANVCRIETALECWLRELADLRARVRQADTYKVRGIQFRPLLQLAFAEMEIAADSPEYFREQYLLLPSSTSGVSANDR